MNIKDALCLYCKDNLNDENDWYRWKKIDESKIPIEVKLPDGNSYFKNLSLKYELHKAWINEKDITKRGRIIKYYIEDWGGIRSNKKFMDDYISREPDRLLSFGKNGIASWSKALTIHNPNKYAIFDARVSISLNYLQFRFNTKNKVLYPILSSQNKRINESGRLIKQIALLEGWGKVDSLTFYSDYLNLLKEVSEVNDTDISTIEMLLFAKAESLVDEC